MWCSRTALSPLCSDWVKSKPGSCRAGNISLGQLLLRADVLFALRYMEKVVLQLTGSSWTYSCELHRSGVRAWLSWGTVENGVLLSPVSVRHCGGSLLQELFQVLPSILRWFFLLWPILVILLHTELFLLLPAVNSVHRLLLELIHLLLIPWMSKERGQV